MNAIARCASLLAVVLGLTSAAHADQFDLTYTFGGYGNAHLHPGTIVDVTFDGNLSGDLITGISNGTLTIDNDLLGSP